MQDLANVDTFKLIRILARVNKPGPLLSLD